MSVRSNRALEQGVGFTLVCDAGGCPTTFVSGSGDQFVVYAAAELAGWRVGKVGDEHVYDCCPEHAAVVPERPAEPDVGSFEF